MELWGGNALERKLHVVKWEVVCSTKGKGGLGVRSSSTLNRALLSKLIWRFAVEREVLWKKVISTKCGVEEGGWLSQGVRWNPCFSRFFNDWEVDLVGGFIETNGKKAISEVEDMVF